jgi:hypothetical protein
MIGYTLPEIRRLLISLVQACAPDPRGVWSWSRWRRRRQYQARLCHYRQRGYALTYLSAVAVLIVSELSNAGGGDVPNWMFCHRSALADAGAPGGVISAVRSRVADGRERRQPQAFA